MVLAGLLLIDAGVAVLLVTRVLGLGVIGVPGIEEETDLLEDRCPPPPT